MDNPSGFTGQTLNRACPVYSLPYDVISQIVFIGKQDEEISWPVLDPDDECYRSHSQTFLETVSQVSAHFRRTALTTPSLWTSILLTGSSDQARVQAYLARSSTALLDVCLHLDGDWGQRSERVAELLQLVGSHSGRWRRVLVRCVVGNQGPFAIVPAFCRSPAPFLESVSISVGELVNYDEHFAALGSPLHRPSIFVEGLPALRSLRLQSLAVPMNRPPFDNLNTLELDQTLNLPMSYAQFCTTITESPTLTRLMLGGNLVSPPIPGAGHSGPVEMASLKYLQIRGGATGSLFSIIPVNLSAPLLESLVILEAEEGDLDGLWSNQNPWQVSFPGVKFLTIDGHDVSAPVLRHLFKIFPNVVSFRSPYSTVRTSRLPPLLEQANWPCLKSLGFAFNGGDNPGRVLDLSEARWALNLPLEEISFITLEEEDLSAWIEEMELDCDESTCALRQDSAPPWLTLDRFMT